MFVAELMRSVFPLFWGKFESYAEILCTDVRNVNRVCVA
jgi:hypothetical protein